MFKKALAALGIGTMIALGGAVPAEAYSGGITLYRTCAVGQRAGVVVTNPSNSGGYVGIAAYTYGGTRSYVGSKTVYPGYVSGWAPGPRSLEFRLNGPSYSAYTKCY